ncbi:unnamed protein product [Effrenium voratum]|uniref:Succinylglutamate desuccinylase/Aspartoacylase catalytic domain-containing protein n=1 Tax=Effrenium voratum TaxID=2562239 RepID=A0AA36J443_9DINO|nr:unnamed protein product [Effrenium voratum]CAJ1443001.1 unnamed protein product [Effrenium voratum]
MLSGCLHSRSFATLREIGPSVWRLGAGRERPRAAVLGGVHGNELSGVEVVNTLVSELASKDIDVNGEVTFIIGNPAAVSRGSRFIDYDLNRCFQDDKLCDVTTAGATLSGIEWERAQQLAPFLRGLDVLLDLHSTNKPSSPFVRLPGPEQGRRARFASAEELFLRALPPACDTVLWDPDGLIAAGGMTDEYALRHSEGLRQAQVCYESGLASDRSSVETTRRAVRHCLEQLGLLPGPQGTKPLEPLEPQRQWRHFQITEVFFLDARGFEWQNGHGARNFQRVPRGEVYGRRLQGAEELRAERESFMVFPKVRNLWALGRPLGWLAKQLEVL